MKNISVLILCLVLQLCPVHLCAQNGISKEQLRQEILSDLKENILPFWMQHSIDPDGGFYGSLTREGKPIPDAPKGGVLNARILWSFSTAYRMYGEKAYREMADRAQRYFIDHFMDKQYDGVYWLLNADGTPRDTDKQSYGCAYAIYGLSEHFRATGNTESLEKAIEIYRTMEEKICEPKKDGYIESFTRKWGTPRKLGYDGAGKATKTMNTHIHVLEAYTSLYRVWKDKGLEERLTRIIGLLTTHLYNPQTHHLILYCNSDWENLDDIDSYGHDIETSWLLTEAAEVLGNEDIYARCKQIAIDMVDTALREGVNRLHAMMYEKDKDHIRRDASWWCQAESVVGCVNAWQLTGQEKYLEQAASFWHFIKTYMIDREHGEWFRTVLEDGTAQVREPKASMWNCPYHNSRMGFEIDSRLK